MIKHKRIALLTSAILAIVALTNLSAQNFSSSQDQSPFIDFSSFSKSGADAKSTFIVSAEVVDTLSSVESYEATEVLSEGGTPQKIGLSISPPRLMFENGIKTAEMTITNIGSLNTIYRILLVNTVFDENGNRTIVEQDMQADFEKQGALFADKMLKFAPRWVRLKPAEQQLIRVATVLPDGMEDGEYRSELHFNWQQDSEKLAALEGLKDSSESNTASSTEANFVANPVSKGMFIPLIIRQGNLNATGRMAQLQLESSDESTVLNLKIFREGNRSLYGDLLISGLTRQNETTGILHTVSNVAIYPPASQINLSLDLTEALSKEGVKIDSLIIEYKAKGSEGNDVIASSTIKLLNGARASAE